MVILLAPEGGNAVLGCDALICGGEHVLVEHDIGLDGPEADGLDAAIVVNNAKHVAKIADGFLIDGCDDLIVPVLVSDVDGVR